MTNKLNRYFNQDPEAPKGVLANYQHATDIFVENNYRLSPRYKFLFHAFFELDNTVPQSSSLMNVKANEEIPLLVKTTSLPSFNFDTVTKNKYNRKQVIYKQINYDSISLTFHDDNAGIMNALWEAYYSYFVNDGANDNASAYLIGNDYADFKYGMDVNTPVRFFKRISLYTLARQKWNGYTLWGPRIKSWKHGDVDYSEGNGIVENSMTIEFEAVSYSSGSVSEGVPDGFSATGKYDREPSPLKVGGGTGGGGTGGGGDTGEIPGVTTFSIFQDPEKDLLKERQSFLNETIKSVENYRDIPLPSGPTVDSVFNSTGVSNQVGGVLGAEFPKEPADTGGTVATAKRLNPLERLLQDPKAPAYTGDDPIVRARLGLPPLTA
jgi:hypothetical protein